MAEYYKQTHPLIIEHLRSMSRQEKTSYPPPTDCLAAQPFSPQPQRLYLRSPLRFLDPPIPSTIVTPQDRRAMCKWGYDIADACEVARSTACIGIMYFDRFISSHRHSKHARLALASKRSFQLSFVTCLVLALKCRGGMIIDSDFLTGMVCQNLYRKEELFEAERNVLEALEWKLNGPSPHDFIAYFMELLPCIAKSNHPGLDKRLIKMAQLRTEVVMLEYPLALNPPSSIALASILSSMQNVHRNDFHPLDRLAFLQSIDMIIGLSADEMSVRVVRESLNELVPPEPVSDTNSNNNNGRRMMKRASICNSFSGVDEFQSNSPVESYADLSSSSTPDLELGLCEISYSQFPSTTGDEEVSTPSCFEFDGLDIRENEEVD